jgi:hypothetical protein
MRRHSIRVSYSVVPVEPVVIKLSGDGARSILDTETGKRTGAAG